jgi:SAM-dependent methyltransferase
MSVLSKHRDLVSVLLKLLRDEEFTFPVLDLACGSGNNGLKLSHHGIPVVFADRSEQDLETISQYLDKSALPGRTWLVDLELPGTRPLAGLEFSAIMVFRYLHRPLFPALREVIVPGGLVVYETFTRSNLRFGRPKNPDFLLKSGELESIFRDWEIISCFEGDLQNPDRSIAQIIARKPDPSM